MKFSVAGLLIALLAPTVALADNIVVNDATSSIQLLDGSSGSGYRFRIEATLGNLKPADRVRADWKQKGKVIASVKCSLSKPSEYGPPRISIECESSDKDLTTKGAIDVDLVYTDDKSDKDSIVHQYHLTVVTWSLYPAKVIGYRFLPDDLLGAAWFHHASTQHAEIMFWMAHQSEGGSLRCAVDGKPLDHNLKASFGDNGPAQQIVQTDKTAKGDATDYTWTNVRLESEDLIWGTADEQKEAGIAPPIKDDTRVRMIDHPGKWTCQVRVDQTAIREVAFTVNAKGRVEQSEINTGKGAVATMPDIVMIENTIPKDAKYDERVRPDAMKASWGFGQKWPDHPKVKTIHATYPAKSGKLPEPQ